MRKGWEIKKLGDCFKLKSGAMMTAKMMSDNGVYPVYGGNGISGLHNEFNLSGSNVIVGRVGALCGNVRHINQEIWLTDNAFQVIDLKFNFDNTFLTYLLNFKNLRSFARQAAQPVISNSSLYQLILEFPNDKKEQQRIVSILDEAFSSIEQAKENLQRNLQNAKELFQSELNSIFANKGEGWEEKTLGEVTNVQRGSSPRPKGDPKYFSETKTEYNWVTISDISSYSKNNVLLQTREWLTEAGSKQSRYVDKNEFIIAVSGSTTGKCCITGINGFIYDGLAVVKIINNTIEPKFLLNYMISLYTIINNSKTGAAFPNINTNYLNNLSIPLPSLKIQKEIVQQIDKLSAETKRLEAMYQQKLDGLEELKMSILQKAFSGELSN